MEWLSDCVVYTYHGLAASAWSVCSLSQPSTSIVQYTILFGGIDFRPRTSITITFNHNNKIHILEPHTGVYLFRRRDSTAYLNNRCLAWYNVLITSQVHTSVKAQFLKVQQTKYTTADSCDSGISVLNHCLSWSKFVNTYLSYWRQWFNIHI